MRSSAMRHFLSLSSLSLSLSYLETGVRSTLE